VDDLAINEDGTLSGNITRKVRKAQVRIEPIPPEEFIVNPNIKCLATLRCSRTAPKRASRTSSRKATRRPRWSCRSGDDELRLDSERISASLAWLTRSAETRTARKRPSCSPSTRRSHGSTWTRAARPALAHRPLGQRRPRKGASGAPPVPVVRAAPDPALSFYGGNYGAKVIPTQNSKTVLTRSILDHAVLANNPRFGVVKGALTNPRELLDNRIGGLVNVTRADGIFPLPQAPLNPFVFQTIEMLDSDKEDVTGVSRLSQGLNKDAISNQNSQGMVEQLIGASMQRQKTIARAFAQQFLKPLYLEVYRLVLENEDRECIAQIAGKFVPVKPADWAKQRDVSIDLRLGYGEKEKLAGEYMQFGQLLAPGPVIAPLFGIQERRNLYQLVMEAKGHKNVAQILRPVTPEDLNPPPDPMHGCRAGQAQGRDGRAHQREQRATWKPSTRPTRPAQDGHGTALQDAGVHAQGPRSRPQGGRDGQPYRGSETEMDLARKAEENAPPANLKASAIISPNG
jgi:hypothetical protein